MKIASVQCKSIAGEVESNLSRHIELIKIAVEHHCDIIFFPELSLTNYEPQLAESLASDIENPQFDILQTYSDKHNIVICVGMPIRAENGVQIGQIIFQAEQARRLYAKQILHEDEYPFFVPGNTNILIEIRGEKLAPAICYESMLDCHVNAACKNGAAYYLASVAKNQDGVNRGNAHYATIAKRLGISVIMANAVGACDNFDAVGGSGVWNQDGECLAFLDDTSEGVLIYDTCDNRCCCIPFCSPKI